MSTQPDAELRLQIAASRGLSAEAAGFLNGSTLEELEASADDLAALVGGQPSQEEPSDLIATARAQQTARKQELLAALTDRGPQPRDEAGRYAARGLFDGGARGTVAAPRDPEAEHTALVTDLALASRQARSGADVGRNF